MVDGIAVPALEIPFSMGKLLLGVACSLAIVAGGVALVLAGLAAVGWVTIVTFGLYALLGTRNLVAGSRVALSERGLHVRGSGADVWVPWDEVTSARISSNSESGQTISVDTTNPARATGSWWSRKIARPRAHGSGVRIPIWTLSVDAEALERLIARLAEDPAARRGVATRVNALDEGG
jgi:hypothetical protein